MRVGLETFSLAGRRALVTGASRGIGRAIAEGLARAGADVAVAARSAEGLAETVVAVEAMRRRAVALTMDVSRVGDCCAALERAADAFAGIDILVNNAGIEQVSASLAVDEGLWDRILDTNLKGAFFCAQAAARLMAGKGGAILNICSLTSEV